ncbi:uncharacterized protein LOC110054863 [Orbicella faveolata]|uniref:uncharacterized protein LOC110054863 n=1 Tax=Orbicella faveolata TaxID=48498 RepID=UPI0009E1D097|nr:uncharacterized protein LOC110054863 [Orbicella faveolata]
MFYRTCLSLVNSSKWIVPARCHSGGTVHAAVIFSSLDKKATKRIEVVQNDLTKENVDAIVNAANSWLKHGGGVAGAVVKSGGDQIQSESDEFVAKNGPVKTGEIAVTGPGNLPCKIVIHAVGPVWEGGQKDEDNSLHTAMYNSLTECHSRLLNSVAVPAISSGIFGFPKARCAKILFSAALEFFRAEAKSSVQLVRLTNFDKATVEVFKEAAADLNDEPDVRVQFGQIS